MKEGEFVRKKERCTPEGENERERVNFFPNSCSESCGSTDAPYIILESEFYQIMSLIIVLVQLHRYILID